MGERTDLPKIKPDEKPSLLNTEAADWGIVGSLVGGLAGYLVKGSAAVRIATDLVFTGAAALYGGTQGMARQEREQKEGRVVKTPGFWNSGILSGFFVSGLIQTPLTYYVQFKELSPKAYSRAITASGILTLGGMITGSIMRKNSLQRDFDKSVAIRDGNNAKTQQLMEAVAANQQAPAVPMADEPLSFKNSVTPDEAAALAEKQAQAPAPTVEKPAHGPHHAAHAEHHEATSHAEKHEHHPHAGSHADKHEPAASHTDHAAKPEASMAMGAA